METFLNYSEDVGTNTAMLLLIETLLKRIVSTPGAQFMTIGLANFYIMTPLKWPEFAKIKLSDIPEETIDEYNLRELVDEEGYVYCEITKGMYGLPQAGIIAQDLLA